MWFVTSHFGSLLQLIASSIPLVWSVFSIQLQISWVHPKVKTISIRLSLQLHYKSIHIGNKRWSNFPKPKNILF